MNAGKMPISPGAELAATVQFEHGIITRLAAPLIRYLLDNNFTRYAEGYRIKISAICGGKNVVLMDDIVTKDSS